MKQKIINFINRVFDIATYKERIRLLEKKIKDLEKERKPLIDLKNKYLSELRVKNMELGRLRKMKGDKEYLRSYYERLGGK